MHHAVAKRYRLGVSNVIRCLDRFIKIGRVTSGKIGGCRRLQIQGEDRQWLLERIAASGFTFEGLEDELLAR